MLSKQVTKIVQNLEKKKFREKYQLFKVEGEKLVSELLCSTFKIHSILAYPEWISNHQAQLKEKQIIEVNQKEMSYLSNFQSLPEVIALVHIPTSHFQVAEIREHLSLLLNGIQDPGNLGTILRLADWFGIQHVFCDSDCASVYNPKCVQASMGAIFRINTHYTELIPLIQQMKQPDFPICGTFLNGRNIYTTPLKPKGFIIMGNEGNGISQAIQETVTHKLFIPNYPEGSTTSESLNVAIATAITCAEFRRKG